MSKRDKLFYDYLVKHREEITEEWLDRREDVEGSIYSVHAGEKTEKMLREQNKLTFEVISSAFSEDKNLLQQNIKKWAETVAESRVNSETPVYEVIDAVNKYHYTVIDFMKNFINETNEDITNEDIWRWNAHTSYALNQLITKFAQLHHEITRDRLSLQQQLIDELSTPIIPISDTVGVVPLIGTVDSERARKIIESLPEKCVEAQIEHLFIDLSGMPVVDTMVVHQVYQLIKLLELLGITSTISGIRPEVAQTAVQLGISIKDTSTFSTLKQAISVTGIQLEKQ